jgi:acyl-[acyl carrier protein]--UDP-N-acetylglucosamine O-acyltransferase
VIHPSAIIEAGAQLGANVSIGAFSIIGEQVEIGDNTVVGPHVVISGGRASAATTTSPVFLARRSAAGQEARR